MEPLSLMLAYDPPPPRFDARIFAADERVVDDVVGLAPGRRPDVQAHGPVDLSSVELLELLVVRGVSRLASSQMWWGLAQPHGP